MVMCVLISKYGMIVDVDEAAEAAAWRRAVRRSVSVVGGI